MPARLQVALGLLGPLAIVGLLPTPQVLLQQLDDRRIDVVLGAVTLVAVTVVVWALLAWASLVCLVAVVARLPGLPGVIGRQLFALITPAAARRILVVAAGVSLAAGATACGTAAATTPAVAGHTVVATSVSVPASDPASAPVSASALAPASEPASPPASPPAPPPASGSAVRLPPEGAAGPGSASGSASISSGSTVFNLDWPMATSVDDDVDITATPRHTPSAAPSTPVKAASSIDVPGRSETKQIGDKQVKPKQPEPEQPAVAPTMTGKNDLLVTVHGGESLWSIAAAHLPDGASNSDIDHAWRAWYSTNRKVIGANPDLVIPGQQLTAPTSVEAQQ